MRLFAEAFRPVMENPSPALAVPSFTGSAAAFAAATLARTRNFTLVVARGIPEADRLVDDLRTLARECDVRVFEFPPALEDDPAARAARLKAAAVLAAYRTRPHPLVLVAPFPALLTPVPAAARVAAATVRLAPGTTIPFAGLQEKLLAAGYTRAPQVDAVGQFSVRGGVVDAWPPDRERPVRAEFFGDDCESLRAFDPGTQISVAPLEAVELEPVDLAAADEAGKSLLDVLPEDANLILLEHEDYRLPGGAPPAARFVLYAGDPPPPGVPTAPFLSSPLPGFAELHVPAGGLGPDIPEAVRGRLRAYLVAAERKGSRVVEDDELAAGFEVPGLVVVTKSDRLLAHRRVAARAAPIAGERVTETLDLEPGELVVHLDYGIGRFLGSTEVEVGDQRSEVFTLEYADGAKLHVPVAHAHLLSRYVGVKGEHVKLHRLDGRRWTKDKAEAQRAVQDLAASLLETQARRAVVPGFAYDLSLPGIDAFEARFPYEETPDQARAIADVKRDLASTKPMDRLVCGDAGYGKTEVAIRAAFVAAMNGKQVALLAPTTVLAEQHYETFLARFADTPVRVEAMSRFQSDELKKGVRARLLSGATDVVVGTHALLSSKVRFHDLGLIIIDEEQRFGVKHKEWLKCLRATADVLTMSATPIPRTLYMSMTGARDLSLLRTPPRERVAVDTKVVRDLDDTVRTAVTRELARGGQVYFLYNRVLTIDRAAERLAALVPEAKIEVAHGQMPADLLAAKMGRFARGETNVLVCTTIVESGLDIPRANTILVDRADRLGMAELYQLRGRVGRGARQGYAVFLLPAEGLVDSDARERLAALRKHAGLGAGFNLALRDLEIRGAGNLLGTEQSGHIAAVGFQLYCQLLQRTIARMKGEHAPDIVDVSLNFDFLDFSPGSADADACAACLPYDYVEEEAQRMDFHKRLAETTTTADVKRLRRELADRYGRLPPAALRLVKLAELRVRCAAAGIARIDVRHGKAVFYEAKTRAVAFTARLPETTADRLLAKIGTLVDAHASSSPQPRR